MTPPTNYMRQPHKWGVWCIRSAHSVFGADARWLKSNGERVQFDERGPADDRANELNETTSAGANIRYHAAPICPIDDMSDAGELVVLLMDYLRARLDEAERRGGNPNVNVYTQIYMDVCIADVIRGATTGEPPMGRDE